MAQSKGGSGVLFSNGGWLFEKIKKNVCGGKWIYVKILAGGGFMKLFFYMN